jgi:hypothetical protein
MSRTWSSSDPYMSEILATSTIPNNVFYFVVLKYDKNADNFSVQFDTTFDCSYTDVLLGFLRRANSTTNFVPYYYSSLKTIMQHYEEIYRR